MLFYCFNSLDAQTLMLDLSRAGKASFQLINRMMSGISIFLAIVLAFLMIYANKYMIRYRSQEFSIYLTLGMPKRRLSMMLFIENMVIGICSLVIGLIAGTFASAGLALLTSYLFKMKFTHFQLIFSASSAMKTIGLFIVIYIGIYLFNVLSLRRLSIIELMKRNQKAERRLKLPMWSYTIIAIISFILFYIGDYIAWVLRPDNMSLTNLTLALLCGGSGVFLFFFSVTPLVLNIVKHISGIYFKNLNPFVFRQLSSEMNTSFVSLSVTCIMTFLSIVMLAGGFGTNNALQKTMALAAPYDGTLVSFNRSDISIESLMKREHIDYNKVIENHCLIQERQNSKLKNKAFLKSDASEGIRKIYLFDGVENASFISLKQFNQLRVFAHKKPITLKDNEYLIVGTRPDYATSLELNKTIHLYHATLKGLGRYEVMPLYDDYTPSNIMTLVVPDYIAKQGKIARNRWNVTFKKGRPITPFFKRLENSGAGIGYVTKDMIKDSNINIGMTAAYLGMYIGLIFLIASAILLSIQQLTKNRKEVEQYHILMEIGATRKQCFSALRKQMAIFFALPVILALFHSIFALHFANDLINVLGGVLPLSTILMSVGVIIAIYAFYFYMTYVSVKRSILSEE